MSEDVWIRGTIRHEVLYDILEHVKLAELQDCEPNMERFVNSDSNLHEISSHQLLAEDADILTIWFT